MAEENDNTQNQKMFIQKHDWPDEDVKTETARADVIVLGDNDDGLAEEINLSGGRAMHLHDNGHNQRYPGRVFGVKMAECTDWNWQEHVKQAVSAKNVWIKRPQNGNIEL